MALKISLVREIRLILNKHLGYPVDEEISFPQIEELKKHFCIHTPRQIVYLDNLLNYRTNLITRGWIFVISQGLVTISNNKRYDCNWIYEIASSDRSLIVGDKY